MIDLFRIHVVWDAESIEGARIAEAISSHFDGIGMERDGVAHRVPVRFSSAPWKPSAPLPRPVELDRAQHNAVVLLYDEEMHERAVEWNLWVTDLKEHFKGRGEKDVYLSFGSVNGEKALPADAAEHVQYTCRLGWDGIGEEARDQRLLLMLLIGVREHFRTFAGEKRREPIFVSHAKKDGDETARAIVTFVNDPGDGVPLETFYDATALTPGEDYKDRFHDELGRGTLIAIVSDVYDSRPWCVWELTQAKRARRPIVLVDVGGRRTSRTFPYGANLPRVHVRPDLQATDWIERILVEAMSEGLRCDLFERQAAQASPNDTLILPRPPELFDIVQGDDLPGRIVYPDPPLADVEAELVARALQLKAPATDLVTLGEIVA